MHLVMYGFHIDPKKYEYALSNLTPEQEESYIIKAEEDPVKSISRMKIVYDFLGGSYAIVGFVIAIGTERTKGLPQIELDESTLKTFQKHFEKEFYSDEFLIHNFPVSSLPCTHIFTQNS